MRRAWCRLFHRGAQNLGRTTYECPRCLLLWPNVMSDRAAVGRGEGARADGLARGVSATSASLASQPAPADTG